MDIERYSRLARSRRTQTNSFLLLVPSEVIREEISRYLSVTDLFRVRRTCTRIADAINEQLRNLPQRQAIRAFLSSCAYNIPRNLSALSTSSNGQNHLPKHVYYQGLVDSAKHGSIGCLLFLLPRFTEQQVIKASFEVIIWRQHLAYQAQRDEVLRSKRQFDDSNARKNLWLALSGDLDGLVQESSGSIPSTHILRILASKAGYEYLIYYRTRYSSVTRFLCKQYHTTGVRAIAQAFASRNNVGTSSNMT